MKLKINLYSQVLIVLFLLSSCIITKEASILYNTVSFSNNMYFDETEVDVGSWLSFYTWKLENEGLEAARKVLPDSNAIEPEVWKYIKQNTCTRSNLLGSYGLQPVGNFCKKCSDFIKYDDRLTLKPEICPFLFFPITGVTYEQVLEFCKWRSIVQGRGQITFRLPSEEEWIEFALKTLTESEIKNRLKDSLIGTCPSFNYKGDFSMLDITSKEVRKGQNSDKVRAYDVFGNVSEMTSTKDIAKGGNYKLYASSAHVDSIQYYSKPEKWLGFRCVGEKTIKATHIKIQSSEHQTDSLKDGLLYFNGKDGLLIDSRDGNEYNVVRIGEQIWLSENIAFKTDIGKYWAYNNEIENVKKFGYFYDWEAAQDACPDGWSLPSKNDYEILLKSVSVDGKSPYDELIMTGTSGFRIISTGFRYMNRFTLIEGGTGFWSSTYRNKRNLWGLNVENNKRIVSLFPNVKRSFGLPVRCIKNSNE